jgi:hypothetical protein
MGGCRSAPDELFFSDQQKKFSRARALQMEEKEGGLDKARATGAQEGPARRGRNAAPHDAKRR